MGVNDFSFNTLKDISKEGEGSDWFSVLLCFLLHLSVLQGSCRFLFPNAFGARVISCGCRDVVISRNPICILVP